MFWKNLGLLIFILLISINVASATDNLTDEISLINDDVCGMSIDETDEDISVSDVDKLDVSSQEVENVRSAKRPVDGWQITINPATFYYSKSEVTYSAYVSNTHGNYDANGENILKDVELELILYDSEFYPTYKYAFADSNGKVSFTLNNLKVGKFPLKINMEAGNYQYVSPTSYIEVFMKTKVVATNLNVDYKQSKSFKVNVQDGFGGKLMEIPISVKVGSKTYNVLTDYEEVIFNTNKLGIGTYKVSISSRNPYYIIEGYVTIKVNRIKTKISAPELTAYHKKSKKFKIKIWDKRTGYTVKHVKILVKVGKKKYSLKTNSKGVASFNTKNLKIGKYKVSIKSKDSHYVINAKSLIKIKKVVKKVTKFSSKKSSSSSDSGKYVGNKNTHKFHYPSCSSVKRMNSANKIYLTHNQAISLGYSSCGICHP